MDGRLETIDGRLDSMERGYEQFREEANGRFNEILDRLPPRA